MEVGGAIFDPDTPLPGFRSVDDAVSEALPALAPVARITVEEIAPRRQIEAGGQWVPWRPDVAPYMSEPMAMVTSRRFDSLVFVGPARSSKSEALVINPLAHMILAQPRLAAVFSPKRDAAREWSIETLDAVIANSPDLAARKAVGRSADNTFEKRFRAGGRITVDWPVAQKLAQRSIPLVIMTDYDAFEQDVAGEGTPFALGRKRLQSAGSRGMIVIETSPRFPVLNEAWSPQTPHEAPPTRGALAEYNNGTRGRLYWTCPDCGLEFEPAWERIHYPDEGSPAQRGAGAYMACLHCGGIIEPSQKRALNASARWLHEADDGTLVPMGDAVRTTQTASYHLAGPAAALAPWSQLVTRYLEGEKAFEETGAETGLKAAVNVELGLPYLPRAQGNSAALNEGRLREGMTDHAWQVCPAQTAFVTVAVDVQNGRFVVQVEAWQPDLSRVVIDRFDLHAPPETAPRAASRRIDPARYAEDWSVLFALADRSYPVAGADHELRPLGVIVDCGGEPGVTPNAYAFWREARGKFPRLFHLVRGRGGDRVKRAEVRVPETAHRGKEFVARDVKIVWAGTDRLKDEIAASLLRESEGARALLVPKGAPPEMPKEYAAEKRTEKGWTKRPGVQRNEALDLSVYALALAIVLGVEAINWDRPPKWAVSGPGNIRAVAQSPEADAPGDEAPEKEGAKLRKGRKRRRPRGGLF